MVYLSVLRESERERLISNADAIVPNAVAWIYLWMNEHRPCSPSTEWQFLKIAPVNLGWAHCMSADRVIIAHEKTGGSGGVPMLPCSLNSPLKPISESVIGNKSFNYLGFIKWSLFNEEILWKSPVWTNYYKGYV